MTAIPHHLKDVKNLQKRLHDMVGQVALINKEETLFGWEKSSYPDIEVLTAESQPFLALFQAVNDWQKSLRK